MKPGALPMGAKEVKPAACEGPKVGTCSSPTLGPSQASPLLGFVEALRVSPTLGLLSAKFHQFQAPTSHKLHSFFFGSLEALQVSPTLGLLKSAFHQFQAPTLGRSQAPSFTSCRPLASCRLQFFLGSLEALQVSPPPSPTPTPLAPRWDPPPTPR